MIYAYLWSSLRILKMFTIIILYFLTVKGVWCNYNFNIQFIFYPEFFSFFSNFRHLQLPTLFCLVFKIPFSIINFSNILLLKIKYFFYFNFRKKKLFLLMADSLNFWASSPDFFFIFYFSVIYLSLPLLFLDSYLI